MRNLKPKANDTLFSLSVVFIKGLRSTVEVRWDVGKSLQM